MGSDRGDQVNARTEGDLHYNRIRKFFSDSQLHTTRDSATGCRDFLGLFNFKIV